MNKSYGRKQRHNDDSRFATDFGTANGCEIAVQEDLNDCSGRKVIWRANGAFESTTAPVSLIMGNKYRAHQLAGGQIVLCCGDGARGRNKRWESIRHHIMAREGAMPVIYGDIVFMRYGRSIRWDEQTTYAEMLFFCQQAYGIYGERRYNFCH